MSAVSSRRDIILPVEVLLDSQLNVTILEYITEESTVPPNSQRLKLVPALMFLWKGLLRSLLLLFQGGRNMKRRKEVWVSSYYY